MGNTHKGMSNASIESTSSQDDGTIEEFQTIKARGQSVEDQTNYQMFTQISAEHPNTSETVVYLDGTNTCVTSVRDTKAVRTLNTRRVCLYSFVVSVVTCLLCMALNYALLKSLNTQVPQVCAITNITFHIFIMCCLRHHCDHCYHYHHRQQKYQ